MSENHSVSLDKKENYADVVFSDPKLLREKLAIFLHTYSAYKTEIYARACEKFYKDGEFKFAPTWSWWAFFFGALFYLRRRLYLLGFAFMFLPVILYIVYGLFGFLPMPLTQESVFVSVVISCFDIAFYLFVAMYAKYAVCNDFFKSYN